MVNKAGSRYWNDLYEDCAPRVARKSDVIRNWIESHIPVCREGTCSCIEIGCYPGRFISVFGELGYELYGIDLAEKLDVLPDWLSRRGYRVGGFWREDFNDFSPGRQFDIVASFGFIEHFTNWQAVLRRHAALVGEQGYLVIEAPNFIGAFQSWLHRRFDAENLARHHVPAMDIEQWAQLLESLGFEILYRGYFGRFHFWTERQRRTLSQRLFLATLKVFKRPLALLLPRDHKSWSPFCGVIARRATGRTVPPAGAAPG